MKKLLGFSAVLLIAATNMSAADDGNTKWRLNKAGVFYPNTSADVIATTSGAGNVKGVRCNGFVLITVSVYVNGGAAESFQYDPSSYEDGPSGWIPFNIRFTSTIRVAISRGSGSSGENYCVVAWGLD